MNDRGAIVAVIAVFGLVIGLAFFLSLRSNNGSLDRSVIGTNGLALWLAEGGADARMSHRLQTLPEDDVLLRVLPLYDVNLDVGVRSSTNKEERRRQETLRDSRRGVVRMKMERVETFLILPKWRAGVLELGLLDRQFLISEDRVEFLLQQLGLETLKVIHPDQLVLEDGGLFLYRPQLFDAASVTGACKPSFAVNEGVLVAKCQLESGQSVHVLSDPDFVNNHGLTNGENAVIAKGHFDDILRGRDGIVYVDTEDEILLQSESGRFQEEPRKRNSEELSRLLTYPFNIIFLSIGMVFFIAFWRGLIRFGPPARDIDDRIGASKAVAIDAKANLLRLVGQDAALTRAFVDQQIVDLSQKVLGRTADTADLMKRLTVLAPKDARELDQVIGQINSTGADASPQNLLALTEKFEETYRRIIDELGHISRRR